VERLCKSRAGLHRKSTKPWDNQKVGSFNQDILLIGADGQTKTMNGMADTGPLYSVFPRDVLIRLGASWCRQC
jgi:hypothetical protein